VGHEIWNPEPVGAEHFQNERVDRFLPQRRVGAGQVDEVRIVRQRVDDAKLLQFSLEPVDIVLGKLLGPPLVVVLREKLDAVAFKSVGQLDGLVVAAGNRLVCAEDRHEA
jgi:hypothetical protein